MFTLKRKILTLFYGCLLLCSYSVKSVVFFEEDVHDTTISHLTAHIEFLYKMFMQDKNSMLKEEHSGHVGFNANTAHKKYYYEEYSLTEQEYSTSDVIYEIYLDSFKHALIKGCVVQIAEDKSLRPLFEAWDDFLDSLGNSSTKDTLFIRECSQLIFILYNQSLCYLTKGKNNEEISECHRLLGDVDAADVRDLYIQISNLPIGRMLILLDKIALGLTAAIALYNKPHEGGFFGWLQKNWWVPPTVVAGIITSIFIGPKTTFDLGACITA